MAPSVNSWSTERLHLDQDRKKLRPMKISVSPFRVREGETVDLKQRPTSIEPFYDSDARYEELLTAQHQQLDKQQQRLYASDSYAVLLIFQAMDAAGKDGAIRHVMSGVNPQGCQVFSYKQPSQEELRHDFLWRCERDLPERGRIGIFNRSYYEEVLVLRVHPELLKAEGVSGETDDLKAGDLKTGDLRTGDLKAGDLKTGDLKKLWRRRYRSMHDLERHLHGSGTKVVKFFLHISKEEQRRRFLARIDEPKKNWKFSMADIRERAFWDDYMTAYEDCLSATSTDHSPWYVVPADDKRNARLIVSRVIVDTLKELKMTYPKSDLTRREELATIRVALEAEKD
jgi:PPK2 family polyphosphate:nucleotide phosphotransferase